MKRHNNDKEDRRIEYVEPPRFGFPVIIEIVDSPQYIAEESSISFSLAFPFIREPKPTLKMGLVT